MPMGLQWRRDSRFDEYPAFLRGCAGYFNPAAIPCRATSPVTSSDMGALTRKDREAFSMPREEIIRREFDHEYKGKIGSDLS